jgi:hypothetical protein
VLRFVQERHGMARRVLIRHGNPRKPPSCRHAGRSRRPWWGVFRWCRACSGLFRQCKAGFVPMGMGMLCSGLAGSVMATTPVQARFPIDAGGVGCVWLVQGTARRGPLFSVVACFHQARAGTGPDQRRRLGICKARLVTARPGMAGCGRSWIPPSRSAR